MSDGMTMAGEAFMRDYMNISWQRPKFWIWQVGSAVTSTGFSMSGRWPVPICMRTGRPWSGTHRGGDSKVGRFSPHSYRTIRLKLHFSTSKIENWGGGTST